MSESLISQSTIDEIKRLEQQSAEKLNECDVSIIEKAINDAYNVGVQGSLSVLKAQRSLLCRGEMSVSRRIALETVQESIQAVTLLFTIH